MKIRSIRGGQGLGDSLYVQSVARHIVNQGERLQVRSRWPDVFRPLGDMVEVVPFSRLGVQILAHYSMRKRIVGTDQFEDCCMQAGIKEPVDLRLDWTTTNPGIVDRVKSPGKPVICVQMPRPPMGRTDGFGAELLPDCNVIQKMIDALGDEATMVQIGSGTALHRFNGIDIDLTNQTTVAEMIDVAHAADAFLGYCSFMVPLAESFSKPAMFVWSRRGLQSKTDYIWRITPEKILHRQSSRFVVDDWTDEQIMGALDGLLR